MADLMFTLQILVLFLLLIYVTSLIIVTHKDGVAKMVQALIYLPSIGLLYAGFMLWLFFNISMTVHQTKAQVDLLSVEIAKQLEGMGKQPESEAE